MNILLIDPVTTAKTIPVEERKKLRQGIGYPGLGLITVAALTPSEDSVHFIDESVEKINFDKKPDLVGIAVQAPTSPYVYELAAMFRKKGIPVVLGGIHVSLNPEEALPHADAVVIGEAELSWPQLLKDFKRGELKKSYMANGLADFDTSPLPRRELLQNGNYLIPHVVQASKGCPYGCEFCSLHCYVGQSPRFRNIDSVIEEIQAISGDNILFADDNIYADKEYTSALFHALRPLNRHWVAESTWHIAYDEDVLDMAKKSGCVGLFIGFDSINQQRVMRKIPKSANVEEIYIKAIQNIQKKGIAVVAAFVFGLDNDDLSVFERSLQVVLKGRANLVNFSTLVPYPGTPIYQRLKTEGRIFEKDKSKFISPNVCYEPINMTAKELYEGTIWAQREFYSLSNIVKISFKAAQRLGWAMGLLSLKLNLAQRRNWGKGSD
jgi:radical SAM superfamily enzyme YgiQ (UPF0313 family)